jgi:hypothetical protein
MNILELIGYVMVITQFIKKAFDSKPLVGLRVKVGGKAAIVVSVLVSVALVVSTAIEMHMAIGFGLVMPLVKVVIGSNMSYSLIKVARNQ